MNCSFCGQDENLKRCGRCQTVFYCSRQHQIKDWAGHKVNCKIPLSCQSSFESSPLEVTQSESTDANESIEAKEDMQPTFDAAPFTETKFHRCPSTSTIGIGDHIYKALIKDNFCVLDDIFPMVLAQNVFKEVRKLEDEKNFKPGQLAGGRTSGEDGLKVTKSSLRGDFLYWFDKQEKAYPNLCSILQKMDDIASVLSQKMKSHTISGRTKAMVACYPGGKTGYTRHVDNPCCDGRLITCIFYLNEDWNVATQGGWLRVFPEGRDKPVDISPRLNRMIFFWSDSRNPHEVHPALDRRYAFTVWYFDEDERKTAKTEQLQSQLPVEYLRAVVDLQDTKEEITQLQAQITEEASRAVDKLSTAELKALRGLVEHAEDPATALTTIGLAPAIQQALLKKLRTSDS